MEYNRDLQRSLSTKRRQKWETLCLLPSLVLSMLTIHPASVLVALVCIQPVRLIRGSSRLYSDSDDPLEDYLTTITTMIVSTNLRLPKDHQLEIVHVSIPSSYLDWKLIIKWRWRPMILALGHPCSAVTITNRLHAWGFALLDKIGTPHLPQHSWARFLINLLLNRDRILHGSDNGGRRATSRLWSPAFLSNLLSLFLFLSFLQSLIFKLSILSL